MSLPALFEFLRSPQLVSPETIDVENVYFNSLIRMFFQATS